MIRLAILAMCVLFCTRCSSDYTDVEVVDIKQSGTANGLTLEETPESVFIHFEERGDTTTKISSTTNIEFKYTGFYLDGVVFDNSFADTATTAKVSSLLNGLQVGLPYFGKGGSGYIFMPSSLGFGSKPPFGMRKNEILAFQIEILDY